MSSPSGREPGAPAPREADRRVTWPWPAFRLPRDRPFHVVLLALAVGLALAGSPRLVAPLVAAAAALLLCLLRAGPLAALAAALLLVGTVLGQLRLEAIDAPSTRIEHGERVELRAHLLTEPRRGAFGSSVEIVASAGRLDGARLLVRAPRWAPLPGPADPGHELAVVGRLAVLGSGESGGRGDRSAAGTRRPFDFAAHLRRRGIAGELLLERVRLTGRRRTGVAGLLDRMRARAGRAVVAGMEREEAALLRGMVLGQDEQVAEGVRGDFRASGLAHLLAVSGQNVMLLAALALPFLMVGGAGVRTRPLVLAGLIALYVPLAGAGPSLQRAGVMGLAGVAALASSRPASRSYALLLAAALTLAWNPRAWADPGWQLSFAAVAGILTLGLPLQRGLRRAADELFAAKPSTPGAARLGAAGSLAGRFVADGVAITVAATLATAPLLAHHFGAVSAASLPANLLALPAVAPAMWLGMLKIALGQLSGLGPAGVAADALASAIGEVAQLPVGFIGWLAERFAALPGAQPAVALSSPLAVVGAYAVLAGAWLSLGGLARALAPRALEAVAGWRRRSSSLRAAAVALALAIAVAATAWALGPGGAPDHPTVRFLDVGQGDATLVQHPDGTAVLFDGGPPEAGVARLLRRAGVRRLALVVATHASRDHHGGLAEVLREFEVGALLDGGDGTRDPEYKEVLREAASQGVRRITAAAPMDLELAGKAIRVALLSPPPRPPGPAPEDPNPRAVVALVSIGEFDLLLSADAESETLAPLELPDVEAMKVPHHGSSDPGLEQVLADARPQLAAIEVGPNTYGHPHPTTLATLRRANVTTYRTDRHGTVTLTLTPSGINVDTER